MKKIFKRFLAVVMWVVIAAGLLFIWAVSEIKRHFKDAKNNPN